MSESLVWLLIVVVLVLGAPLTWGAEPPTDVSTDEITIVTLGDSITKGVRSGVASSETFSALLESQLRSAGYPVRVVNMGIGGERTDQALKRFDKIVAQGPAFVTIMYGTNDGYVDIGKTMSRLSLEDYRANLETLVRKSLEAGIEPILMTEPRFAEQYRNNGVGEHPNVRLAEYVEVCREVAAELQVPLIDHFARWTTAVEQKQSLGEWTTDGCHPNPTGHLEMAATMRPVIEPLVQGAAIQPYRVEPRAILEHDDGEFLWFHPRATLIPASDEAEPDRAVMTLQKHLGRSDYYSGLNVLESDDGGATWTAPAAPPELEWTHEEGGVRVAVADVTPGWHAPTGRVLAVGAQVRYSPEGRQLEDKPRAHQTAYSVYDPTTRKWSAWQQLEMPAGDDFNFARSACAQFVVEEDGTVLFPCYVGPRVGVPFSTTVVRCSFDGVTLKYIEHGPLLKLDIKRGLYEPSLVKFGDRYWLTMRNDDGAYVTFSEDGLTYRPIKPWVFDDGALLGSYNTQQHWITLNEALFLVYTRKGVDNDHIFRHRAPLLMAQVDPDRVCVLRGTEQVLVAERGATLGNSGIAAVSDSESWVTVSEGIWTDDARIRGAKGTTWLARVVAAESASRPPVVRNNKEPLKVVCFGDSVTGLYYHTGGERAYTDLLGAALRRLCPNRSIEMVNAGISGHTTVEALKRLERDVLAKDPDVVTIMFGLNDMVRVPLEDYRRNLISVIEQIEASGAQPVLCTPNAVIDTPRRPIPRLEEYCAAVRDIAAEKQLPLFDAYREFTEVRSAEPVAWRLMMSDEIHPNLAGHRFIAEGLARTLTGRTITLTDLGPQPLALRHTWTALERGEPIEVLAMPPFDAMIEERLRKAFPEGDITVTRWETDGKTLPALEQEAQQRVRKLKPTLVVIAVPGAAEAASQEEFLHSYTWIMNWSLSFGRREWDCVVLDPDVVGSSDGGEFAEFIPRLARAQDVYLLKRDVGSNEPAEKLFGDWLEQQGKWARLKSSN